MKIDMKFKKANFIDKSIEIRETFGFADPVQILEAINTYCGDHYGSMIWDLYSEGAGQYFRCWNTAVKLVWNVPRSTHAYFVNCQLAASFVSIRPKLLAQETGLNPWISSSSITRQALKKLKVMVPNEDEWRFPLFTIKTNNFN